MRWLRFSGPIEPLRLGIAGAIFCWALLAAALPGTSSAAAAEATIRAGALQAEISPDPWHLSFSQAAVRGPTLTESEGRGSGPVGSLGFRTADGWQHATRVLAERAAGQAYEAELETTDPSGRRLDVRFAPDAEGVIRGSMSIKGSDTSDVEAVGIGFDAAPGERYVGFGERSNAVNQRGNEVEDYVSDGPYQPEERALFELFVPPPGYHPRDDATYFPMPWLLSTAGYGVLIENSETSYFRLATETAEGWSLEVEAKSLAFRVFAGPDPADVVERLTEFTGRQPKPGAPWFLGPWYQPIADDPVAEAEMLREADVPSSAANTFIHYLPCGAQVGRRDTARDQAAAFHELGYAITTYFNPMVCDTYQPVFDRAVDAEVLTKDELGEPYLYRYTTGVGPDREFMVGQFDFSAPGADAFYGELLDEAVADGFDGWMEDFGEYTPPDSTSANGMRGDRMHNRYPVLYHRSSYRYAKTQERPVAGYIRSGWTGVHRYAQLVWGGDPTQDWGFDGLQSAVYQGLNMGMSGISRWGSAIGGFFAIGSHNRTPELLKRWIELGAVSGIMRTEKNGVSIPARDRPQITDPEILPVWRRYTKLRTQLYPYIQAADLHYRRTGLPLMRHMALAYPADSKAVARDDQFMFGPDLLAAPVVTEGATSRELYLPRGRWVDLGSALRYREGNGELRLRRAKLTKGGRELRLDAPVEQLPLLARAGALITMLPPTVDTLADVDRSGRNDVVGLAQRKRRLRLLAFPRGSSHAKFGLNGTIRSRERRTGWRLAIEGQRRSRYGVTASMRTLKRPFRPCELRHDGRRLGKRRWSYSKKTGVLRAALLPAARQTRLSVRRCGGS